MVGPKGAEIEKKKGRDRLDPPPLLGKGFTKAKGSFSNLDGGKGGHRQNCRG